MKCNKCGSDFPDDVNFCPYCGEKIWKRGEAPDFSDDTRALTMSLVKILGTALGISVLLNVKLLLGKEDGEKKSVEKMAEDLGKSLHIFDDSKDEKLREAEDLCKKVGDAVEDVVSSFSGDMKGTFSGLGKALEEAAGEFEKSLNEAAGEIEKEFADIEKKAAGEKKEEEPVSINIDFEEPEEAEAAVEKAVSEAGDTLGELAKAFDGILEEAGKAAEEATAELEKALEDIVPEEAEAPAEPEGPIEIKIEFEEPEEGEEIAEPAAAEEPEEPEEAEGPVEIKIEFEEPEEGEEIAEPAAAEEPEESEEAEGPVEIKIEFEEPEEAKEEAAPSEEAAAPEEIPVAAEPEEKEEAEPEFKIENIAPFSLYKAEEPAAPEEPAEEPAVDIPIETEEATEAEESEEPEEAPEEAPAPEESQTNQGFAGFPWFTQNATAEPGPVSEFDKRWDGDGYDQPAPEEPADEEGGININISSDDYDVDEDANEFFNPIRRDEENEDSLDIDGQLKKVLEESGDEPDEIDIPIDF